MYFIWFNYKFNINRKLFILWKMNLDYNLYYNWWFIFDHIFFFHNNIYPNMRLYKPILLCKLVSLSRISFFISYNPSWNPGKLKLARALRKNIPQCHGGFTLQDNMKPAPHAKFVNTLKWYLLKVKSVLKLTRARP